MAKEVPETVDCPFVPFKDLNDVPEQIVLHQGARLSLEQVNHLVSQAYTLGTHASPNLGEAWVEFRNTHKIENTHWIKNDGSDA